MDRTPEQKKIKHTAYPRAVSPRLNQLLQVFQSKTQEQTPSNILYRRELKLKPEKLALMSSEKSNSSSSIGSPSYNSRLRRLVDSTSTPRHGNIMEKPKQQAPHSQTPYTRSMSNKRSVLSRQKSFQKSESKVMRSKQSQEEWLRKSSVEQLRSVNHLLKGAGPSRQASKDQGYCTDGSQKSPDTGFHSSLKSSQFSLDELVREKLVLVDSYQAPVKQALFFSESKVSTRRLSQNSSGNPRSECCEKARTKSLQMPRKENSQSCTKMKVFKSSSVPLQERRTFSRSLDNGSLRDKEIGGSEKKESPSNATNTPLQGSNPGVVESNQLNMNDETLDPVSENPVYTQVGSCDSENHDVSICGIKEEDDDFSSLPRIRSFTDTPPKAKRPLFRSRSVNMRPRRRLSLTESENGLQLDENGVIQIMNDIKSMKTSLLKLKRELQEAPLQSPLANVSPGTRFFGESFSSPNTSFSPGRRKLMRRTTIGSCEIKDVEKDVTNIEGTTENPVVLDWQTTSNCDNGENKEENLEKEVASLKSELQQVKKERDCCLVDREELEHELLSKNYTIKLLQTQLEGQEYREEIEDLKSQIKTLTELITKQHMEIAKLTLNNSPLAGLTMI